MLWLQGDVRSSLRAILGSPPALSVWALPTLTGGHFSFPCCVGAPVPPGRPAFVGSRPGKSPITTGCRARLPVRSRLRPRGRRQRVAFLGTHGCPPGGDGTALASAHWSRLGCRGCGLVQRCPVAPRAAVCGCREETVLPWLSQTQVARAVGQLGWVDTAQEVPMGQGQAPCVKGQLPTET